MSSTSISDGIEICHMFVVVLRLVHSTNSVECISQTVVASFTYVMFSPTIIPFHCTSQTKSDVVGGVMALPRPKTIWILFRCCRRSYGITQAKQSYRFCSSVVGVDYLLGYFS